MNATELMDILKSVGIQQLRQRNQNIFGRCPSHDESRPSWGIAVTAPHKHGCFACGYRGNLRTLLLDKGRSLSQVNDLLGEDTTSGTEIRFTPAGTVAKLPLSQLPSMDESELYPFVPVEESETAMAYLESRKIGETTVVRAKVHFDQRNNRLVFPWYWNNQNLLMGYTTRTLSKAEEAAGRKTLTADKFAKGRALYLPLGLLRASNTVILVEGEIDALKVAQAGFENVAAIGQGQFTQSQESLLANLPVKKLCLFFDNDDHGKEMTQRTIERMISYCEIVVVDYDAFRESDKKDPAEIRTTRLFRMINGARRESNWPKFLH